MEELPPVQQGSRGVGPGPLTRGPGHGDFGAGLPERAVVLLAASAVANVVGPMDAEVVFDPAAEKSE